MKPARTRRPNRDDGETQGGVLGFLQALPAIIEAARGVKEALVPEPAERKNQDSDSLPGFIPP